MTISKIRQIESVNLKKMTRPFLRSILALNDPQCTFEAGNINSAITSTLVRYPYHCPILDPKRISWETSTFSIFFCNMSFLLYVQKLSFLKKSSFAEKTRRVLFYADKKSLSPIFKILLKVRFLETFNTYDRNPAIQIATFTTLSTRDIFYLWSIFWLRDLSILMGIRDWEICNGTTGYFCTAIRSHWLFWTLSIRGHQLFQCGISTGPKIILKY